MDIEIRRGLAEARALAGDHWQPLLAYGALGVLLPFLLLSSEPIFSLRAILAIMADPFTYRVGGSITGPLYLLGIVAVLSCGAMLAAWNALLVEFREGYISEIMYGMVGGTAYLLVNILLYVGLGILLTIPIILLIAAVPQPETYGTPFLVGRQIVSTLIGAWINARFCLVGPIMGARGKLDPVSAFVESWRRTRTAWPRLFGLYLVVTIVITLLVLALLAPHIFIVLNSPQGGVADMVMSGAWLAFWMAYFLAIVLIPAGLYRASEPVAASEVFA